MIFNKYVKGIFRDHIEIIWRAKRIGIVGIYKVTITHMIYSSLLVQFQSTNCL